jgi:hypothetical protein
MSYDDTLGEHLADPEDRLMAFRDLCAAQDLDADKILHLWERGQLDPDAGYDPESQFHGKDIASLVLLLEDPLREPARRG